MEIIMYTEWKFFFLQSARKKNFGQGKFAGKLNRFDEYIQVITIVR